MLHGHEASGATAGAGAFPGLNPGWFGVSYGVLRKLGTVWTLRLAGLLSLLAGVLAPGPDRGLAGRRCRLTGLGWQRLEQICRRSWLFIWRLNAGDMAELLASWTGVFALLFGLAPVAHHRLR